MLLCDTAVIMQNAVPCAHGINYSDNLQDVFVKVGQSMQAACHILRDDRMFEASAETTLHMT